MASPASPSPGNGTQGKKRARASGSPLGTGMWAGIERARDLMLVARALAEGVHHGRHRTPDRGASTEFYDYRPYVPGDPTQLVDWRLWGRTDRFFIRRFRQDSQLTVMLVVDGSASMDFSGIDTNRVSTPTKLRRAQELAAAIAYLAVRQGDRVGLIVTGHDKRERRLVSPAPGWPALHAVINSLESLRGDGRGGNALQSAQSIGLQWHGGGSEREVEPSAETPNLAAGLRLCAAANRQRGFAIAIGDALDEPGEFFEAASRLRFGSAGSATGGAAAAAWRGSDVALLQILTDDELDLSRLARVGTARLLDAETDVRVRADPRSVAASYNEKMSEHLGALRAGMVGLGGRYVLCPTSGDPVASLRALLTRRGPAS